MGEVVCNGLKFAKLLQGKWCPTGSPVFPAQSHSFFSKSSKVFSPSDKFSALTRALSEMVSIVTLSWLHREKCCELVLVTALKIYQILLPEVQALSFLNSSLTACFFHQNWHSLLSQGAFHRQTELHNSLGVPGERRSLRCENQEPVKTKSHHSKVAHF